MSKHTSREMRYRKAFIIMMTLDPWRVLLCRSVTHGNKTDSHVDFLVKVSRQILGVVLFYSCYFRVTAGWLVFHNHMCVMVKGESRTILCSVHFSFFLQLTLRLPGACEGFHSSWSGCSEVSTSVRRGYVTLPVIQQCTYVRFSDSTINIVSLSFSYTWIWIFASHTKVMIYMKKKKTSQDCSSTQPPLVLFL